MEYSDAEQAFLFPSEKATSSEPHVCEAQSPLAWRLRPRSFEDLLGQLHLTAPEGLLVRLVRSKKFVSLLFYGPPGSGKTSLAEVIGAQTASPLIRLNAVDSNVAQLREALRAVKADRKRHPILVIDEIHRFNKAQQDVLLPDLESGAVRLIGLTTHHPGHYLIPALLSRSHLFRLEPLSESVLKNLLGKALVVLNAEADPEVLKRLIAFSDGDARRALNALETLLVAYPDQRITIQEFTHFAQERHLSFDRDEDEHYNTASAFIKSIRGGDPDAALYWLAKMLIGGEDPRFIARRLVISASEDIGLADPRALPLAVAAFQACEWVGPPECELNLAHVTVFLATSPKSNSAYLALKAAKSAIAQGPVQQVPVHLRDSSSKTAKRMGYGAAYLYSHDFKEAITGQEYMEKPQRFYEPKAAGAEAAIAQRLEAWKALKSSLKKDMP